MDAHNYLEYKDIPGWCAGTKVSGITSDIISKLDEDTILEEVANELGSVAVVSVRQNEEDVINWLVKHGWDQGPWYENHGYKEGHMTCLFTKQVPRELLDRTEFNEGY
jgi:hypothetical protein